MKLPRMGVGTPWGGGGVSVDGSGSSCSIEESQQKVKKLVKKKLENTINNPSGESSMVCMRPGKPGKSWNLKILNSRPEKS